MTATSFPVREQTFRTGCSIPQAMETKIVPTTHQKVTEERFDYFSTPLGFISRIGVAATMACTILGSGAMHGLTQDGLREVLSRSRANLVRISTETENSTTSYKEAETRTVSEQLREIRKSFGLNATDLATLLSASRPTIYAWLDGQEPRPETAEKILWLVRVADDFAKIGLHRAGNLVKRPIFENGASFFDFLKQGQEVYSRFDALCSLDKKEAVTRSKARGSGQVSHPDEESPSESIPLYPE